MSSVIHRDLHRASSFDSCRAHKGHVSFVLAFRAAVLLESGLSFLGLGDPGDVSLGTLLFYARRAVALVAGACWLVVLPGLVSIERNLRVKEKA